MSWKAIGSLKPIILAAALVGAAGAAPVLAEEGGAHSQPKPPRQQWSFAGAFGAFDQAQLRRGFKVYKEVCASCHSLSRVAFRNLAEKGGPALSEAQAKEIAESYKIKDGPNDAGEYFERPGRLSDRFPPPFPNEQAARAAMNGAYPPDMSVLAKARGYSRGFPLFLADALPGFSYQEHGVDYIVALLTGYIDAPQGVDLPPGQYYDIYMAGHRIGMPPPLSEGVVTYDDGTPQTVDQYAKDVSAFLMWTAEPHLEARKSIGLKVLGFLIVLSVLVYFTKRKIWSDVH